MLFGSRPTGFVPVTDPMQWHCVRCDARLNLRGERWLPSSPQPRALFAEDAKKVCPECSMTPVLPIEQQVNITMADAALRIALGR